MLIKVDNMDIEVLDGSTVLSACVKLGISVPTLCNIGLERNSSSCQVCLVKNSNSGELLPACSTLVMDGMQIITSDKDVKLARKESLELLLSEHIGDCEAPCVRSCPFDLDIPSLLDSKSSDVQLYKIILEKIPFPWVVCKVCSAPCEKACRRRIVDKPVSIRDFILKISENYKSSEQVEVDKLGLVLETHQDLNKLKSMEEVHHIFHSSMAGIYDDEKELYLSDCNIGKSTCLHCDCKVKKNCDLRKYSTEYSVKQSTFRRSKRDKYKKKRHFGFLDYLPGKCILCGKCITIAKTCGSDITFVNRGYDTEIFIPDNNMDLTCATLCSDICPTAALLLRSKMLKEDV